jgi:hypothetical protein
MSCLLVFLNWRKKNGGKVYKSDLLLLYLFIVVGLSACEETPEPLLGAGLKIMGTAIIAPPYRSACPPPSGYTAPIL